MVIINDYNKIVITIRQFICVTFREASSRFCVNITCNINYSADLLN